MNFRFLKSQLVARNTRYEIRLSTFISQLSFLMPLFLITCILIMGCGERENKHLTNARMLIQQGRYKGSQEVAKLKDELNLVLKDDTGSPEALCPLKALEIVELQRAAPANIAARQEAIAKIMSLVKDIEHEIKTLEDKDKDLLTDDDKENLVKLNRKWNLSLEPTAMILVSETGWIDPRVRGDVERPAFELLIEFLKVSNPVLQNDIVNLIVSLKDQAYEVLIEALQNDSSEVRRQVVITLGKIGDERAIEPLTNLLNDEDAGVRFYIPVSLDMIGSGKIIEPLHKALKNEMAQIRMAAADILGRMEDLTGIDILIELLADDNSYVKNSATNALIKIGEPVVLKTIEVLKNKGENVSLPPTDFVGDKIGNRYKKELAKRAALQVSAASLLGNINDPRAIQPLLETMKREADAEATEEEKANAASIRSGAAAALVAMGPAAVEPLIRVLESGESQNARVNAIGILGSVEDKRAVAPLIKALKDENKGVRAGAAESLGKLKDRRATIPLIEALKDSDVVTRANAAAALGLMVDKSATLSLIDVVKDASEREKIRDAAITSLGTIKDTAALGILVQVLIDEYEKDGIRKSTSTALRTMEKAWASEPLIGLLKGEIVYGVFMPRKGVISKWLVKEGDKNLIKNLTPLAEVSAIEVKAPSSGTLVKIYVKEGEPADAGELIGLISYEDKEIKQEERSSIRSAAALALGKVKGTGALPALMSSLRKDKSAAVRKNAATALRELEKADARSVLIDALKDDSGVVRSEAAYALGVIKGADSVPPLINSLRKDKYESTRVKAAWSLGEIADKRAAEPLIDSLVKGRKGTAEASAVIAGVITALDKIAGPAVEHLVAVLKDTDNPDMDEVSRSRAAKILGLIENVNATEALIAALKDKSVVVRSEAAKSLGLIADRRAVEPLINVLKDGNEWVTVRANAATSLGKIKDELAVMPLIDALEYKIAAIRGNATVALGLIKDKRATMPLIRILENEKEDDTIRTNAIGSLGSITDTRAVGALVMALKSVTPVIRQNAAVALGDLETGEAVGPLMAILGNANETVDLRASAAEALGKIGDKRAASLLRARLGDYNESDTVWNKVAEAAEELQTDQLPAYVKERANDTWESADVRFAAFMALANNAENFPILLEMLQNATKEIRSGAALALGQAGRKEAVPPLIDKLQNDGEEIVRRDSAKALASLADPASEQALIKALKEDAKDSVKIEAAIALGNIKGKDGIAALITTLQDTSKANSVRWNAATALGDAGSSEAVPALKTALEDKIAGIHFEAAEALRKITKTSFGYER